MSHHDAESAPVAVGGLTPLLVSSSKANQGSALIREAVELMQACPRDGSYLAARDWLVDELEELARLVRGGGA